MYMSCWVYLRRILLVKGDCLYCAWGVAAVDDELVVGGYCDGISVTYASMEYFY